MILNDNQRKALHRWTPANTSYNEITERHRKYTSESESRVSNDKTMPATKSSVYYNGIYANCCATSSRDLCKMLGHFCLVPSFCSKISRIPPNHLLRNARAKFVCTRPDTQSLEWSGFACKIPCSIRLTILLPPPTFHLELRKPSAWQRDCIWEHPKQAAKVSTETMM